MAKASEITVSPVMQVIRVSLILFNIMFWITGFCLFVIGIWATVELNKYEEFPRPNDFDAVSIVLIIIGLVIACIGICGCYGAMKKNTFVLKMFAFFLGVIIVCEISVAIAGYAYRTKIKSALSRGLNHTMKAYKGNSIVRAAWNKMQREFDCCGDANYTDWFKIELQPSPDNFSSVPESCCKHEAKNCGGHENVRNATEAKNYIYTEGCYDHITDYFRKRFSVLASGALSIAIIQFFSIACAGCFWNHVQNKSKYELV
ncbi:CD63 antigen-like [Dendronephthya gigantea]|uniref:CD63 antigen-like n=1 Tax=Dendronephthya gigantea TaxID=151771 RepID=UPI00106ABDAC|nr:CD63 antigen-like [Dendronephthya gigantea]